MVNAMFYFLVAPYLVYHGLLIAAAIVPAIFLMVKVYRSDKLEKESSYMIWNLVKAGIFSALLALVEERVLSVVLDMAIPVESPLYNIILYFGIVAFSEELIACCSELFELEYGDTRSDLNIYYDNNNTSGWVKTYMKVE